MRHLYSPLSVLAVALAIAPAALAEPEAHARQRLETRGVAIGSVRLSLEGAPSLTVLDLGRPAPATAGSDATGAFDETRYPLTPKRPVPGLAAQLRLREYPARGLTVGLLDYQGPTLAARESVQVVMTLPGYGRGMAITRYNPYWTGPAFASDYRLLPEANTLTLWQRAGKPGYELLVPLAGQGLVGEVGKHQLRFGVTLAGHAPTRPSRLPLFVHASGSDPYGLTRTAYEAGFATAEPYGKLRWQKPYPAVFDRLGWCSWNAYYQRVDEAKLLESAASLRAKGLPIGFMLIDDGWMQLAGQQLKGHGAEPGKFPHGLKWLSDRIKRTHGIPHVGVWHTLQGYWEGVAPASAATEGHRLFAGLDGQVLPDPRDAAGKSFYDAWYGELANAGIDFIKVDGQANNARMTDGLLPRLASAEGSHRALQEAAAARFGLGPGAGALPMLNCMSLAVEHAYSWRHANLVRTSNDYDPDQPLTSKEHVLQNAYNAYWAANFAFPDYDMFESHRPDAAYHAIARAISGGPVYTADRPGRENAPLLKKLARADGTLLRVDEPGQVTRDMLLRDAGLEPLPLKLFGRVRRPGLEAGLVAAFNANKTAKLVVGSLSRTDVEGLAGPAVAVFAHGTQHATVLDERHRTQSVRLDEYGAALYTLVPIEHGAAVFGLLDKFVGPAAVKQVRRERTALHVTLDEGGTFGAYLVRAPRAVHVDGRKLEPRGYRYASGLLQVPIGAQGREVRVTLAP